MSESSPEFSAEDYFRTQPPPSNLDADIDGVRAFVKYHAAEGRRVVLVTSGGTTVPLELNVVRFLDNFSAGTRGATSAEYFLRAGYAVIFMHRQFSLQPFSRHYSHSTNPFLDFLDVTTSSSDTATTTTTTTAQDARGRENNESSVPNVIVKAEAREFLTQVLKARQSALGNNRLHTLTFVTVNDYLFLLRAVSEEMACLKRNAMYYLAAAVSDFFLPKQKMSEHKIQSKKGSLHIEMDQVPKVLKPMVQDWTPESFVVSFKLETDSQLLIPKARAALERYGHQVVIGNMLDTRKYEVVFVSTNSRVILNTIVKNDDTISTETERGGDKFVEDWLRIPTAGQPTPTPTTAKDNSSIPVPGSSSKDASDGREEVEIEIEELIVQRLTEMHDVWIKPT